MTPLFENFQKNLLEIIEVFKLNLQDPSLAQAQEFQWGADAKIYSKALTSIQKDANYDVLGGLQKADFRPFFLVNGLIFFSSLKPQFRRNVLVVLAAGLHEFESYFYHISEFQSELNSAQDEKKFFAFLMAYLTRAGMDFLGIVMTMKGDSSLEESAAALRQILEGDQNDLLTSQLFDDQEKTLLKKIASSNDPKAWEALSSYLIQTYQLPLLQLAPIK